MTNRRTDGQTGLTEGRTDRPTFIANYQTQKGHEFFTFLSNKRTRNNFQVTMHIKLLLESKQCGIEIRKFIRIFKRNTLKEKILLCQLDSDYNITLSEKLCMVWYKKM